VDISYLFLWLVKQQSSVHKEVFTFPPWNSPNPFFVRIFGSNCTTRVKLLSYQRIYSLTSSQSITSSSTTNIEWLICFIHNQLCVITSLSSSQYLSIYLFFYLSIIPGVIDKIILKCEAPIFFYKVFLAR